MQTKNVYYTQEPDRFAIRKNTENAVVEFPVNVREVEIEKQTYYLAETVYSIATMLTLDLEDRINADFEAWLEKAKQPETEKAELYDVIEALNTLAEIVIGGDL